MRKFLAISLAVAMVVVLLAGCSLPFIGARPYVGTDPFEGVVFSDYVELGDVYGIEVPFLAVEFTDDELMGQAVAFFDLELVVDPARTVVEEGDSVKFDFTGYAEGVGDFDGGMTAEDFVMYNVGNGSFIPGFEEELIGQRIGVEFSFDITFPENYFEEELAGLTVEFTCTIHAIGDIEPLTDEMVLEETEGMMETVEELLEWIAESMVQQAGERNPELAFNTAFQNATILGLPQSAVDYWQVLIDEELAEMDEDEIEEFLQFQGLNTMDDFMERDVFPMIERDMFVWAVAEQEGFCVEDEFNEWLDDMLAVRSDMTEADVYEEVGSRAMIMTQMMFDVVLLFIYENAVPA